jgi:hypothetical protein
LLGACTNPAAVGDPCIDTSDCKNGLSCIGQGSGADAPTVCMTDCDLTMTRLCDDGSVCTAVSDSPDRPADLGVCYLGGTLGVGAPCTANGDCGRGTICVSTSDGMQACAGACETTMSGQCAASETCTPLTDMGTAGFCQAAP